MKPKEHRRSLMIFRRDLRLPDNTALRAAMETSDEVIPCFILDPRQTKSHPYFSLFGGAFLRQSLEDLRQQFEENNGILHLYEGIAEDVIEELLKEHSCDAVFLNRDYTPFSRKRDAAISERCSKYGAKMRVFGDALLHEPEEVHKDNGKPYTIFTPFYKKASLLPLRKSIGLPAGKFGVLKKASAELNGLPSPSHLLTPQGGRKEALSILGALHQHTKYTEHRDFPERESGTTLLSAHLKFGTCSVREVHAMITQQLGDSHPLLRQLYWRDFFSHIAFHFPHVFGSAFQTQFNSLQWNADSKIFDAWCSGKTGIPIVDAGMRQLNTTGFMHNRVRMITASFLVKDLHVDWRKGEQYFATKLTDYDPCVNNGNWQWAASTGCDAVPYFRIFNPWIQQEKFDPECLYIKRWIPELSKLDPKIIHRWSRHTAKEPSIEYPAPIVDHAVEASITKSLYAKAQKHHS